MGDESYRASTQEAYLAAKKDFEGGADRFPAALEYGRSAFEWAKYAQEKGDQLRIAEEGVGACEAAITLKPRSAEAHYYLGMNLGQVASVKRFSALGLVKEMVDAFEAARGLDQTVDYAGPDRNLGLMYFKAPGWPISVGDKEAARRHLERAVELDPSFPDNHLCLAEAYAKWKARPQLAAEMRKLEPLLGKEIAPASFPGEWARNWSRWRARFKELKVRANKLLS